MKLIDLLVKELPRLGGWPTCDNYYVHNSVLCGIFQPQWYPNTPTPYAFRALKGDEVVYESQYEAALAKAQQKKWSGEGLPPVGCECEYSGNGSWARCKVVAQGREHTIINTTCDQECVLLTCEFMFRPTRTEAELKRENAVSAINDSAFFINAHSAGKIYDAIAAGKIPGVKIE